MEDSAHHWRTDAAREGKLFRRLTNNEGFFHALSNASGETIRIFTTTLLDFDRTVDYTDLLERLQRAWIHVRLELPTIAAQIEDQDVDCPTLEVSNDFSEQALASWSRETAALVRVEGENDAAALPSQVEQGVALPTESGFNACLVCYVPKYKVGTESAAIGIWINHDLYDGPSSRIILSLLRKHLANPSAEYMFKAKFPSRDLKAQLQGTTHSLLVPEGDTYATSTPPEFFKDMSGMARSIVQSGPAPNAISNNAAVFSQETFTQSETNVLLNYCRRQKITVTPLLLATLLVRIVIKRHNDWPLPESTLFTQIFPCDPREALQDRNAVGVHSVYRIVTIPLGQIFAGRSRDEVANHFAEIVVSAALSANECYTAARSKEARIEYARCNEANLQHFVDGVKAGQIDLSSSILALYSDSGIDATLSMQEVASGNGLGSAVRDFTILSTSSLNTIAARAWALAGRTSLLLSAPRSHISQYEMKEYCIAWKQDLLTVAK